MRKALVFFGLFALCLGQLTAQSVVIDRKGTRVAVDTSKWTLSGTNIINKNTGNVGIGTTGTPAAKLDVNGSLRIRNFSAKLDTLQGGNLSDSIVVWRRSDSVLRKISTSALTNNIYNRSDSISGSNRDVWMGSRTLAFDTTTLFINPTTNRLGVGNNNPTERLDVTGNLKFSGALMPNNLAGTSGQLLTSSGAGTAPTWINSSSLSIAGGDVIGTLGNDTVVGLRGRSIANIAPANGQVLTWDASTSAWRPAGGFQVVTVTGTTYTLSAADLGVMLDFTSNSAITLTVPNTLAVGFQVSITQAGTGQITIAGSGGMVVNNRWNGNRTSGRWAKAGIEVRAANSAVLSGDVQ